MEGCLPSPTYAFMAWSWTSLPLPLLTKPLQTMSYSKEFAPVSKYSALFNAHYIISCFVSYIDVKYLLVLISCCKSIITVNLFFNYLW